MKQVLVSPFLFPLIWKIFNSFHGEWKLNIKVQALGLGKGWRLMSEFANGGSPTVCYLIYFKPCPCLCLFASATKYLRVLEIESLCLIPLR